MKVSCRCYPDSTANILLLLMVANAFYSKPMTHKIQWPKQILTFLPGPGTSLLQENPHLFPIGEVSYHHTVRPSGPDNIKCIWLILFSVRLKGDKNLLHFCCTNDQKSAFLQDANTALPHQKDNTGNKILLVMKYYHNITNAAATATITTTFASTINLLAPELFF